jgi:plasmid replication initiation protein
VIRAEQIILPTSVPDEVVEAAAKAAYENQRTRKWDRCGYVGQQQLRRDARAAIAAALNAWPGRALAGYAGEACHILPLPQEPRDD